MAPLETLLSIFKRRLKPDALESSSLSKLPPELLAHIATFLPAASAASFALCCTPVYALLAIPYLKCKRGHHPFKRSEFLSLLERDLKDYIACYHCAKLHTIKFDRKHILDSSRCDSRVSHLIDKYIGFKFSHVVFQMAMKRHRQGSYSCWPLLRLLDTDKFSTKQHDFRETSSVKIANGTLIARHRSTFIIHRGNDGKFSKYWVTFICPHFSYVRGRVIHLPNGKAEYRMFHKSKGNEVEYGPGVAKCDCCAHGGEDDVSTTCSGLIHCDYCATEFRVDSMAVGRRKEGRAFIITRWKNLGEGKSVDDPSWSAHVTEGEVVQTHFVAGSICAAFEGKEEVELASLLTRMERTRLLKFRC